MKPTVKLLTITICTLFLFNSYNTKAQCDIDDWNALKALYESTNGDNWDDNTGWEEVTGTSPTTLCNLENLYGVDLDVNGRVSSLSLKYNSISGNIPPELGNLSNLTYLSFWSNSFIGNIPPELGNLSNLTYLSLYDNQLIGNIPPELGNLSNLIYLRLGWNYLSGNIPPELGNLSNLTSLYLSIIDLNGNIPPELGNLSNLKVLNLGSNEFTGNIPPELGNLSNLTSLYLHNNYLSGDIPPELGNLNNLEYLSLYKNDLIGNIPPELGNLSNLIYLHLRSNNLIGNIPPELGNLSKLTFLSINDNNLSGCFDNNLTILCAQLNSHSFDGNPDISDGNNFDATWEDFCATGAGLCGPVCGCTDPNACNYDSTVTCDDNSCLQNCNTLPVWPGDLNYDGICNNQDRSISYLYHGENGPSRNQGGINWVAYTCEDWGIPQPNGYDIKHHDCDGNGNINTNDANAITLNYGKTHLLPAGIGVSEIPVYANTDFQILLQPINQVSPNSNTIIMNVVLDSKSGQDLEVFGGHFTIDYSGIFNQVDNAVMNFESLSWLGNPGIDLLLESWHNDIEHTIEVGFTKTNGVASVGKGIIGKITFVLNSNNLNRSNSCENLLDVAITKIGSFNAQQDTLQIEEEFRIVNLGMPCCEPFININENTPFQNLYQSSGTITSNGYLPIGQNQQVQYNANRVNLNTGFSVRAGADFKVRSSGCN